MKARRKRELVKAEDGDGKVKEEEEEEESVRRIKEGETEGIGIRKETI